ncbi:MAG: DNA-formamidopyrimidine glycosylase family protein, partial [Acidimicrobiia bacterium]
MPELPEIAVYLEALERRIVPSTIDEIRISSFSLLRTYDPPVTSVSGAAVVGLSRVGKRIVVHLEDQVALVIHLMVAGRLHWHDEPPTIPKRRGLASFDFSTGSILLTEAGTKRRASLHIVREPEGLAALDPGGIEVATATPEQF